MRSGNGRHRRPRQVPALVVTAGVTGSALALPLLAATNATAADTATWDKVAECESGGSWSANSGSGAYGGLQFTQEEWKDSRRTRLRRAGRPREPVPADRRGRAGAGLSGAAGVAAVRHLGRSGAAGPRRQGGPRSARHLRPDRPLAVPPGRRRAVHHRRRAYQGLRRPDPRGAQPDRQPLPDPRRAVRRTARHAGCRTSRRRLPSTRPSRCSRAPRAPRRCRPSTRRLRPSRWTPRRPRPRPPPRGRPRPTRPPRVRLRVKASASTAARPRPRPPSRLTPRRSPRTRCRRATTWRPSRLPRESRGLERALRGQRAGHRRGRQPDQARTEPGSNHVIRTLQAPGKS